MAKLLKLRRGTTSQHSSFTGAEGEVTVDTDKDTLVVHDGSTAGGHELLREDMSNLPAGTIDNADVDSSAAISGTKISPDFGSQNITTTGTLGFAGGTSTGNLTISSTGPQLLFTDTNNNPDYSIWNNDGTFRFVETTSNATRFEIQSGGLAKANNNLQVVGNITVSGTVDGVDVAALNTTVSGNLTTSNIASNAQIDLSKLETITSNRIVGNDSGNAAPKELTAAEVRTIINVENGATADQSASDIRGLGFFDTSNDGSGSGLDADRVDGLEASQFLRSDGNDTATGQLTLTYNSAYPLVVNNSSNAKVSLGGTDDPYIQFKEGTTDKAYIQWNSGGWFQLTNQETSESLRIKSGSNGLVFFEGGGEKTVWHSGNDGSGSGLDADTLDGVHGANFLRSDTGDTANGDISFGGGAGAVTVAAGSDIRIYGGTWTGEFNDGIKLQPDGNNSYFQYEGTLYFRNTSGSNELTLDQSGNLVADGNITAYSDARLKTDISTINDALSICGKLRGVSYKWLKDGSDGIGVIAQEVEEVLPEVVLTNQDVNPVTQEITEIKSVDYGKIVGVLINAINELKAEVDELKGGK